MPGSATSLLIRPSFAEYRARYLTTSNLLFAGLVFVGSSVTSWLRAGPTIFVIWAVAIVAGVGYLALYFRNTSIEVSGDAVRTRGAFGRTKATRQSHEVRTIVFVGALISAATSQAVAGGSRSLLLLDAEGRRIARAGGAAWKPDDLAALVEAFPTAEIYSAEAVRVKDFAAQFPRALPWAERHPWVLGWAVALVIIVGVVVGVMLFAE